MKNPYSTLVLSDTPIGYWLYDDSCSGTSAPDGSGNSLTGLIEGSPTLNDLAAKSPTGSFGIAFDGATQDVKINHNALLNFADIFSLEAWVIRGATAAQRSIISKASVAYQLSLDTNGAIMGKKPNAGAFIETTAVLGAVGWHHVVVTKTGGTSVIYRDSAVAAVTNPTPSTCADNTNPLYVGADFDSGQFFNGIISDAAVYNYVLTAAQVQKHWAVGKNPFYAARNVGLRGNYGPLALRARYMARPQTVAAIAAGSSQEVIVG